MSGFIEWDALGKVVVWGLLVGAGLPALFALGVRSLAGPGAQDDDGRRPFHHVAMATVCFALVVGAITWAIVYIGSGKH